MKEVVLAEAKGVKGKKFLWRKPGQSPTGYETTQEEVDNAIKGSQGGGRGGSPPR
jgi:hypothetical protein